MCVPLRQFVTSTAHTHIQSVSLISLAPLSLQQTSASAAALPWSCAVDIIGDDNALGLLLLQLLLSGQFELDFLVVAERRRGEGCYRNQQSNGRQAVPPAAQLGCALFLSLSLSPEIALTTETSNNQRRGRCSLVLLVGGQGDQKRPALVDLPADSYSLSLIGKLNSVTAPLSPCCCSTLIIGSMIVEARLPCCGFFCRGSNSYFPWTLCTAVTTNHCLTSQWLLSWLCITPTSFK